MKKIIVLGIIVFSLIASIFADTFIDSGFHISYAPIYAFDFGEFDEIVYSKDSMHIDYKLSELNWNLRKHSTGFSTDFGWKWVSTETKLLFAFSGDSGKMFDSDWQDEFNHSVKTNYSISENSLIKAASFEFGLTGILPLSPESKADLFIIKLKPYVSYTYSFYDFSANNGEGWYGTRRDTGLNYTVSYDSEYAKHLEKGSLCGIDYFREHNNLFIGAGLDVNFLKKFNLFLSFDIAVYSSIKSIDTHYHTLNKSLGTKYLDVMQGYFQTMRFSTSLNYNFYKDFYICVDYLYSYQPVIKGNTYIKHSLNSSLYRLLDNAYSGSAGSTHRFSIYVKIKLGKDYFLY